MSGLQTSKQGQRLWAYWVHGKGAVKIGWGSPSDYNRCVLELGKHVNPGQVHGLCANMHIAATGMTTTQHAKMLGGEHHQSK